MKQVLEVARPWKNTFGSHSPEGERPSNASFRRSLGVRAGPTELPPAGGGLKPSPPHGRCYASGCRDGVARRRAPPGPAHRRQITREKPR